MATSAPSSSSRTSPSRSALSSNNRQQQPSTSSGGEEEDAYAGDAFESEDAGGEGGPPSAKITKAKTVAGVAHMLNLMEEETQGPDEFGVGVNHNHEGKEKEREKEKRERGKRERTTPKTGIGGRAYSFGTADGRALALLGGECSATRDVKAYDVDRADSYLKARPVGGVVVMKKAEPGRISAMEVEPADSDIGGVAMMAMEKEKSSSRLKSKSTDVEVLSTHTRSGMGATLIRPPVEKTMPRGPYAGLAEQERRRVAPGPGQYNVAPPALGSSAQGRGTVYREPSQPSSIGAKLALLEKRLMSTAPGPGQYDLMVAGKCYFKCFFRYLNLFIRVFILLFPYSLICYYVFLSIPHAFR